MKVAQPMIHFHYVTTYLGVPIYQMVTAGGDVFMAWMGTWVSASEGSRILDEVEAWWRLRVN